MIRLTKATRDNRTKRYQAEHNARVARTWASLREAWRLHYGQTLPKFETTAQRATTMRYLVRQGLPPGWQFESRLAAEDIGGLDGMEHLVPDRPGRPTKAAPGTPEKIAVLAARVAAGETLFHPDDAAAYGTLD